MRLTLYCEHSRWPVRALSPAEPDAGVYDLDIPRDWWTKAAPILSITAKLLKPFLDMTFAVTGP